MNKKELKELLEEILPHLGHTRECGDDMTGRGERCYCRMQFNPEIAKPYVLLPDRVKAAIKSLQPKKTT